MNIKKAVEQATSAAMLHLSTSPRISPAGINLPFNSALHFQYASFFKVDHSINRYKVTSHRYL